MLTFSSYNRIYHNNFISNFIGNIPGQAYVSLGDVNTWDDGYPSGGNYWSDYRGKDEKRGPNQDQPGSDGIGDTPYTLSGQNKDNYPLMNLIKLDRAPPTIETPSRTPDGDVLPDQSVKVSVNVTDDISQVKNATLSYTINDGETWTDLPMSHTALNL